MHVRARARPMLRPLTCDTAQTRVTGLLHPKDCAPQWTAAYTTLPPHRLTRASRPQLKTLTPPSRRRPPAPCSPCKPQPHGLMTPSRRMQRAGSLGNPGPNPRTPCPSIDSRCHSRSGRAPAPPACTPCAWRGAPLWGPHFSVRLAVPCSRLSQPQEAAVHEAELPQLLTASSPRQVRLPLVECSLLASIRRVFPRDCRRRRHLAAPRRHDPQPQYPCCR